MEASINEIDNDLIACPRCGNYSDISYVGYSGKRLRFYCNSCYRAFVI